MLVMILRMFGNHRFDLMLTRSLADVIVQGHRFNIFEDIGCVPTIYNTPPAYPLVFMWPIVLGCISFVYAGMYTMRLYPNYHPSVRRNKKND